MQVHEILLSRKAEIPDYIISEDDELGFPHLSFDLGVLEGTPIHNLGVREITVCCPPDAMTVLEIMAHPSSANHPLCEDPYRCYPEDEQSGQIDALIKAVNDLNQKPKDELEVRMNDVDERSRSRSPRLAVEKLKDEEMEVPRDKIRSCSLCKAVEEWMREKLD